MRRLSLLLLAASAASLRAQSDWTTVQQSAVWVNAFLDHAVSDRTALWFDGHWRRDGMATNPQQVLLRPGVQFTLRPRLRLGAGYAYIATAPYGAAPSAAPLREHRIWQQATIAQRLGNLDISHRVRWEQRWLASVQPGGDLTPSSYAQRARYFVRAQRPLGAWRLAAGPVRGFVWDEIFVPIAHADGRAKRLQNRVGAGLAFPVSPRQRLEVGYMHQWNRITPRETHEINHTLVLSWAWTARR
ncbi:MAG: DUF2490 domain-containing protein [Gemmatimonadaceae bacterium]|nr:DUF2490 domain-containing protein [Gemmatimonadaceae bacterium]